MTTPQAPAVSVTPEELESLQKLHMLCGFHAAMFVASQICAEHFAAADAVGSALRARLDAERSAALSAMPQELQAWAWECANATESRRPKR